MTDVDLEKLANADLGRKLSRRGALAVGGGAAATLLAGKFAPVAAAWSGKQMGPATPLPVQRMLDAMQTNDHFVSAGGVLNIKVNRTDISLTKTMLTGTGPAQIPFETGFEVFHLAHSQSFGADHAMVKGVWALKPEEVDPVVDELLEQGLVMMALHQHFMAEDPQLFHIHFRGVGGPVDLARAVNAVIEKTSTPLPYVVPPASTTPLPAQKLAEILGGHVVVGVNGFVLVTIPRKQQISVAGYPLDPSMGVQTNVQFEPLDSAGTMAAAAPDFSMLAGEIDDVMRVMRRNGFGVNCLYNQATNETPQLFFSHQIKVGDPVQLAMEVREGLNQMDMAFVRH